jgi:hypothetical protein
MILDIDEAMLSPELNVIVVETSAYLGHGGCPFQFNSAKRKALWPSDYDNLG